MPTFPGVAAHACKIMLDDYYLPNVLGFLGALLYRHGSSRGLNDITSGLNVGCDTNGFSTISAFR
ncbi:hypothetical protein V8E53_011236 [Lactarius tabidus]|jgi:hypothetical protein